MLHTGPLTLNTSFTVSSKDAYGQSNSAYQEMCMTLHDFLPASELIQSVQFMLLTQEWCCCSINCLHPNVYIFPCSAKDGLKQTKKTEIQPWMKNTAVVWSQTHIVSIALDNIISYHLQGWNHCQHHGKPCEGVGGWVGSGCDGNTASSKFRGTAVESSAYF